MEIARPALDPGGVERAAASALGVGAVELIDWRVESVDYPATTPSTLGLERVVATVRRDGADAAETVRMFVKTLGSMRHSPLMTRIPPELHEMALAGYPWHVEVDVFASTLLGRLPPGLRAPTIYRSEELGDERSRLWMEDVAFVPDVWGLDRYVAAARSLGQMTGRIDAEASRRTLGSRPDFLRTYLDSRVRFTLPMITGEELWHHPVVAANVDPAIRSRLRTLWERTPALLDRRDGLARAFGHGDACPQNLLADANGGFVAIDWGIAWDHPIGSDLAQLLIGRAESLEIGVDELREILPVLVPSFADGLRSEGAPADEASVRDAFLTTVVLRSAFLGLPIELLMGPPPPGLDLAAMFRARSATTSFLLDLGDTL